MLNPSPALPSPTPLTPHATPPSPTRPYSAWPCPASLGPFSPTFASLWLFNFWGGSSWTVKLYSFCNPSQSHHSTPRSLTTTPLNPTQPYPALLGLTQPDSGRFSLLSPRIGCSNPAQPCPALLGPTQPQAAPFSLLSPRFGCFWWFYLES